MMPSDTNHGHDGQYGQELLDHTPFDSNQAFLYSNDYSTAGMQDPPQQDLDAEFKYLHQRSPSPHDFNYSSPVQDYSSPPHHNNDYDFQLFGSHEPPQQSINPALFEQSNPESHSIDPNTIMQQAPVIHHSHSAAELTQASVLAAGLEFQNWEEVLGNPSFQTHRPAASVRSDISSAAASPLFNHLDQFPGESSPLLGSMGEFLNNDQAFGLEQFTLSESTHHSPAHSPRITPMRGPGSGANSPYMLPQDMLQYGGSPAGLGLMAPPQLPSNTMHDLTNRVAAAVANHEAMHQQYAGPQIQIEFAPPQRQPTFPGKPGFPSDQDALSPPLKCMLTAI